MQPTQGKSLECLGIVTRGWGGVYASQDAFYIRLHVQDPETQLIYLIYTNKNKQGKEETEEHVANERTRQNLKKKKKKLNEMEISNLPYEEFKVMVIRMLSRLEKSR